MGCALQPTGGQTPAEERLEWAAILDAEGKHQEAAEYRALAAQILNEQEAGPWIKRAGQPPRRAFDNSARPASVAFVCGEGIEPCGCGYAADFLCDYPMGGRWTCDAPICGACRTHGASGRQEWDWCPQHTVKEAPPTD